MNELIMDYLVREGFKEAAERFREEAGIEPARVFQSFDTMDTRIGVKQLIEEGEILKAIAAINLHYPEFLDLRGDIYFKLQQQHLIELIRQKRIEDCISYANDQELQNTDPSKRSEIEKTMTLLAFSNPEESPYSNLMQIPRRLQLASEINDFILQDNTGEVEPSKPRLVTLLKLLLWTQNQLERKRVIFPKMTDLVNGTIIEPRIYK